MKKLFHLLFLTIIFPAHIFGILFDTALLKELKPIITFFPSNDPDKPEEDTFPYELKKKILLEFAQNVHRYSNYYDDSISRIIFNVSLVNKDLYKELDKQRNDPIAARFIIMHFKYKHHNLLHFDSYLTDKCKFPGAQKCFALSKELYEPTLTPDMIENLFQQGVILDLSKDRYTQSPLIYWCMLRNNQNQDHNKKIIKKLLDLGANPNECGALVYVIEKKFIDYVQLILNYKPIINNAVWLSAMITFPSTNECIDLLLSYATKDELNAGLICCFHNHEYKPNLMQKFIDNGANPNIALPHLMKQSKSTCNPFDTHTSFNKNFTFFCEQKAFDKETLTQLKQIQSSINSLVSVLEKNQPDTNDQTKI